MPLSESFDLLGPSPFYSLGCSDLSLYILFTRLPPTAFPIHSLDRDFRCMSYLRLLFPPLLGGVLLDICSFSLAPLPIHLAVQSFRCTSHLFASLPPFPLLKADISLHISSLRIPFPPFQFTLWPWDFVAHLIYLLTSYPLPNSWA